MADLKVNEIFFSIQGETSRAGLPCVFVRLTGCNLRCGYCDTTYAYEEGETMSVDQVVDAVSGYGCDLVEITGGEPMAQAATPELARKLVDLDFKVMVETNGSFPLDTLPKEAIKIVDIKTPGSGEVGSFHYYNLHRLTPRDELKFVVCSRADFDWALREIDSKALETVCGINISPAAGLVSDEEAASWVLHGGKALRLNLQLHKMLWGAARGR